jgi:uncharacterized phage-associated protein
MPGWSPEVANYFITRANEDGRALDQMQLQGLVYAAHGTLLGEKGRPLTSDRPEAKPFGAEYRRLADALAYAGTAPVVRLIQRRDYINGASAAEAVGDFETIEKVYMSRVYRAYGHLRGAQLDLLMSGCGSACEQVYAKSKGLNRDISHDQVRAQFERLTDFISPEEPAVNAFGGKHFPT